MEAARPRKTPPQSPGCSSQELPDLCFRRSPSPCPMARVNKSSPAPTAISLRGASPPSIASLSLLCPSPPSSSSRPPLSDAAVQTCARKQLPGAVRNNRPDQQPLTYTILSVRSGRSSWSVRVSDAAADTKVCVVHFFSSVFCSFRTA